jgi:hypothetical protein
MQSGFENGKGNSSLRADRLRCSLEQTLSPACRIPELVIPLLRFPHGSSVRSRCGAAGPSGYRASWGESGGSDVLLLITGRCNAGVRRWWRKRRKRRLRMKLVVGLRAEVVQVIPSSVDVK